MKSGPTLWDIPTRALHWALAVSLLVNLFVLEEGEEPHRWNGYLAVGLVTLRLLWGLVGGAPSRLGSLPLRPSSFYNYMKSGLKDEAYQRRHNPLAALVYVSLWALVFGLGISGWMMGLDAFWGEDWVEDLHLNLGRAVQALILLHLLGILIDSVRYRRATWLGMINGRRERKKGPA
jgi:cytochrome b